MSRPSIRVLLVDRDAMERQALTVTLLLEGFDVDDTPSLVGGAFGYDAVIVCVDADQPSSLGAVLTLKQDRPKQHVMVIGGRNDLRLVRTSWLPRPPPVTQLVGWLNEVSAIHSHAP